MWAVLKLRDLELQPPMEVELLGAWGEQGKPAPGRVDGPQEVLWTPQPQLPVKGGPEAGDWHKGACSCCTKLGGQGQRAWVGRLSELMEMSEDTTDETMEGEGG
eukprot:1160656-Pelagomonas_calceolata.AAC.4